ncbi:hypothetical protein PAN31108_00617 [Pandoraea anhela]|uniref:Uncharacterized protein n=1 Tax=Pandoraea anhela TaxID=2508295 RepID=A0A5E4S4Y4_9BURK|nr:hypothetical protein PAN31108_00617 [Pandoraea anhela]
MGQQCILPICIIVGATAMACVFFWRLPDMLRALMGD